MTLIAYPHDGRSYQLINDEAGDGPTEVTPPLGALPQVEAPPDTTAQHEITCEGCGRPPGPVAAPGVLVFDLGVKHCLNRLSKLLQRVGASKDEADVESAGDELSEADAGLDEGHDGMQVGSGQGVAGGNEAEESLHRLGEK